VYGRDWQGLPIGYSDKPNPTTKRLLDSAKADIQRKIDDVKQRYHPDKSAVVEEKPKKRVRTKK
jgi:hypothetical protein